MSFRNPLLVNLVATLSLLPLGCTLETEPLQTGLAPQACDDGYATGVDTSGMLTCENTIDGLSGGVVSGGIVVGQAPTVRTTLVNAMSPTDDVASVQATVGYPPSGVLLIGSEAIGYSATTANSFEGLTRGAFGTTSADHAAGTVADNYLTIAAATPVDPRMVVTGSGRICVRCAVPTAELTVMGTIEQTQTFTNLNRSGIFASSTQSITTSGQYYNLGMEARILPNIASGRQNTGYAMAFSAGALRDQTADVGTLNDLIGMRIQYGNYTAAGSTGRAIGLLIDPYHATGSIGQSHGILLTQPVTGASVGTYYPIYQEGSSGVNYFAGSLGLGDDSPDFTLDVVGTICQDTDGNGSCDGTVSSDARLKKNVATLTHGLDKVRALRGIEFEWREDVYPASHLGQGKQIGFVAQEVEQVLPELVYEDGQHYKMVDYQKVTAVLVEAVKEQQAEIGRLRADVVAQREINERMEARLSALENRGDVARNVPQRTGLGSRTWLAALGGVVVIAGIGFRRRRKRDGGEAGT